MEELKELLKSNFPAIDWENGTALATSGALDSVTMVGIITLIEDKYGIEVTMEYIRPESFESVEAIWNMVDELS